MATSGAGSFHRRSPHMRSPWAKREPVYRAPNLVSPNSAFCVDGCERQNCGGALTVPPSWAAACQGQRGS
jgi:hypothetical protein